VPVHGFAVRSVTVNDEMQVTNFAVMTFSVLQASLVMNLVHASPTHRRSLHAVAFHTCPKRRPSDSDRPAIGTPKNLYTSDPPARRGVEH
jgi:hypothetical protein